MLNCQNITLDLLKDTLGSQKWPWTSTSKVQRKAWVGDNPADEKWDKNDASEKMRIKKGK